MGSCLAEKQHTVKKVQKSRSGSTGRVSCTPRIASSGRSLCWMCRPFSPSLSLKWCKRPNRRMLTPDIISCILHTWPGWCSMLTDWQFKIITASASPPPPDIPSESLQSRLLQTPRTKQCLDIDEPRTLPARDKSKGLVPAEADQSLSWAWKWG